MHFVLSRYYSIKTSSCFFVSISLFDSILSVDNPSVFSVFSGEALLRGNAPCWKCLNSWFEVGVMRLLSVHLVVAVIAERLYGELALTYLPLLRSKHCLTNESVSSWEILDQTSNVLFRSWATFNSKRASRWQSAMQDSSFCSLGRILVLLYSWLGLLGLQSYTHKFSIVHNFSFVSSSSNTLQSSDSAEIIRSSRSLLFFCGSCKRSLP